MKKLIIILVIVLTVSSAFAVGWVPPFWFWKSSPAGLPEEPSPTGDMMFWNNGDAMLWNNSDAMQWDE